jgi:ComF family protein
MPDLSLARSVCLNLGSAFFDLIFPPICHICKCHLEQPTRLHLCQNCKDSLIPINPPLCTVCGIPFTGAGTDHPCGHCITSPPAWTAARSAYAYEGACRDLIHNFKYGGKALLRRPLAYLMADQLHQFVTECRIDLIIPVPLHKSRLQSRGFNQAVLLCEPLSRIWQLPLLRQGLVRTRPTGPQVELTHDERISNIKDAFAVNTAAVVKGKRVLLVDDVYTTGSTLNECSKTLIRAGVEAVFAVTAAQAPVPH